MAYVLGVKTSVSSAAAATYDPDELAEHVSGDLLLACITQDGGGTTIATATSGWTAIGTQAASGGSRQAWFYKIAASSAETIPSFSGALDDWSAHMITVRDADTTTPIETSARSDWNAVGTVNSPAITTSTANCLVLYSWGSDNTTKMWTPPASMFVVDKAAGLAQASIVGYRNQRTAGAATTVTMTHEAANEGGNAWAIAIKNASGGSLGADVNPAVEVLRYYGGSNVNGTFSALSTVAATINGFSTSANVPTNATNTPEADSPWGNSTTFTSSASTTSEYEGVIDTLSSAVNASGKLITFLWRPNASVTTARYGTLGVGCVFVDGSGNWVAYQMINYVQLRPRSYLFAIEPGQGTPLDQSASPIDPSNITKIGWFIQRSAATTSSGMVTVKSILLQSGATVTGGALETPITVDTLYKGITAGWDFFNTGALQGSAQYLRKQPIQIGDGTISTYANFSTASIELPKNQESLVTPVTGANFIPSDNTIDFVIKGSATDTFNFASSLLVASNPQQFRIDSASSSLATYDFLGCSIIGYEVENNATGVVFNGATFSGTRGVTLNGGGMSSCVVSGSVNSTAVTTSDPGNIVDTTFVSVGSGHAIEITATGTFDFEGNIFTGYGAGGTTDACIYNNSGGAVTLVIPATDQTPTIRNGAGASTTISQPTDNQKVILSGGVANSRVQIYDVTSSTELVNQIVTSFPFTWEDPSAFVADREIRLRVAYNTSTTAKDFIDQIIGTATAASPTITYLVSQQDDDVYITNAIDGTSVTGITIDDASLLVEVDSGSMSWQELYAYESYWLYTEEGIRDESRFFEAPDTANYRVFGFKIKNITSPTVPLVITGGYGVDGDTGNAIDIIDTTGGTIFSAPNHVVAYEVTGGGGTGGDTKEDIYTYFTSSNRQNTFRDSPIVEVSSILNL